MPSFTQILALIFPPPLCLCLSFLLTHFVVSDSTVKYNAQNMSLGNNNTVYHLIRITGPLWPLLHDLITLLLHFKFSLPEICTKCWSFNQSWHLWKSLPDWVGHSHCVAICDYLLQIRTTWITAATMVMVVWIVNRVYLQQVAAARQRFRDTHMQNEVLMTQGCLLQRWIQHTQKWCWTQGLIVLHQIAFLDTCESSYNHYYVWLILYVYIQKKRFPTGNMMLIWYGVEQVHCTSVLPSIQMRVCWP